MAPSFILFILVCLGGFLGFGLIIALLSRLSERGKQRGKQLEILEQALKRGDMNDEIRREVVAMIRSSQRRGFSWWHALFSLGWIGLFVGGGLLLLGGRHAEEPGWITLVVSFALVTLPLAISELDARRAPDRRVS